MIEFVYAPDIYAKAQREVKRMSNRIVYPDNMPLELVSQLVTLHALYGAESFTMDDGIVTVSSTATGVHVYREI